MTRSHVHIHRQMDGTPRTDIIVPSADDTSNSFGVAQATAGGFQTPATLTSTTVGWEVSYDNETWVPLKEAGTDATISYAVSAGGGYALPFELFMHAWARFVFGSAEGADRTIVVTLEN